MPLQSVVPLINSEQFRSDFVEFTDENKYPDSAVDYWLAVGTLLLNPVRWGNLIQLGLELFVAHHVVLEGMAHDTAIKGGWPGLSKGVIQAENAGPLSINYDTGPSSELEAGHWNLTVYGTRFIHLTRMAGAGPVQVGPGCDAALAGFVSGSSGSLVPGWSGPSTLPGWFS